MNNSKLNRLAKSKYLMIMFICLIIGIFSLRVIHLDRDLPAWGIGYYQPIDEGSYSILSLNLLNHNTINPSNLGEGLSYYTPSHVRTNVIGNVATYIGLNTLGDNYYGLRLPYVIICLINFILITLILFQLRKKYGEKNNSEIWIILLVLLYLAIDFPFTLASRVVEPSTVRLLFVLLTISVYLGFEGKNKIKYFTIGFIITTSVFAVYITNVFLVLAVGIVLLYLWKQEGFKKFFVYTCYFALGCFIALGICEIYYFIFWKTEAIMNMFGALFDFSSVSAYSGASGLRTFIRTLIRFFSSNELLYNIPVLFCVIFSLPLIVRRLAIKRDTNLLFLTSIVISFLLQTLASEDYIIRKFIVIYPIFIFLLYLGYLFKNDWNNIDIIIKVKATSSINNYLEEQGENKLKSKLINVPKFRLCLFHIFNLYGASHIIIALAAFISFIMVVYRTILCHPDMRADYDFADKLVLILCLVIPMFIVLFNIIWKFIRKLSLNILLYIGITFISSFLTNFYFCSKYIYLNPTYTEKNIMIALKKDVGDNIVLGEYENGFTLYNNIKPVLNTYDQLKKYMEKNNKLLYFDYFDEFDSGMRYFFNNTLFEDSKYTVLPIKVYSREYQTYGVKKRLALYNVVTKEEAAEYYKTYLRDLEKKDILSDDEIKSFDKLSESYQDVRKSIITDITGDDIYVDIYGNIDSSIYSDIYGTIYGDIDGNIYGDIYGDIYGNVNGNVYGNILGKIYGELKGKSYNIEKNKEDSNEKN